MTSMVQLKEHSKDLAANSASYVGKGKAPQARSSRWISPIPLRILPPPSVCTATPGVPESSNLQLALCPTNHDQQMEHDMSSMLQLANGNQGEAADVSSNSNSTCMQMLQEYDSTENCPFMAVPSKVVSARSAQQRIRKAKIAEAIKVLKNSVPCSGTSNKSDEEAVLDDAIDYIKYLKLQLKLLSQDRLGCQTTPFPFVSLEGYGHYIINNQNMCNDPLEEIMGNLVQTKPQIANDLLERKGLSILPTDFAYTLLI